MKKYLIAVVAIICFSSQLKAQITQAYKKVATDTNRIVYDEQGNALHYYQYSKLVNSGDYTIRYHGRPGETDVQAHLVKLTDEDRARMLLIVKERFSIKSEKLKEGKELDLKPLQDALPGEDLTKKAVFLIFWDVGCPQCTDNFAAINDFFAQLPNAQDVIIIAITANDKGTAEAKLKEKPLLNAQQIVNAGALTVNYGITNIPDYVVADKDHIIRLALTGTTPVTLTAIKTAIKAALAK